MTETNETKLLSFTDSCKLYEIDSLQQGEYCISITILKLVTFTIIMLTILTN